MEEDFFKELKEKKIWMLWVWKETADGKKTKVPKSAINFGATGTNEAWSHTLVTFDEAVSAMKKFNASGVGFSIPEGYFFEDIDHRDISDPLVQKMIRRFDSYAEYSVSGTGIHIYGKCNLKDIPHFFDKTNHPKLAKEFYQKNPGNDVELYIGGLTNRFAVYTGNVIHRQPLAECTQALLTTLDKDMRRKKVSKTTVEFTDKSDDAEHIIYSLRRQKNGEKFSRLFDEGDISDYTHPTGEADDSRADAALCSMIAFRTGPDPNMIDAIFRKSALMRQKWNREDYKERTIQFAIESCDGNFYAKKERPYFICFDENSGKMKVSVPLLAKYVRENLNYVLVRDNGKQGVMRYVYKDGVYRLYSSDMMLGEIKKFIADYDEMLVNMNQVSQAFTHISTDLNYISQDDLNSNEDIINFQNGILYITDKETRLIPHSPEYLSTIQIPCEWTGSPKPTPIFDSYMRTLTNGNKSVERLLLEFIGACISNINGSYMKKALFLVGAGNTGKSQLKRLVEKILGKGNYISIDLRELESRFGTSTVYNTRLTGSSDMSFMSVTELKAFKQMTGGDSLFAEFKGQQGFEFNYKGLLWFCMNRLPKFGGDDGQWVYDRIMVINCTNVIPTEKQDKKLLEKMYAEREGIIYKAVTALQGVIANGYIFSEPECVVEARQQYKSTNNTVICFFNECMSRRPDGRIRDDCSTGKLYNVYRAWCNDNNNGYAKTAREFREELANHLETTFQEMTVRRNNGTFYKDYTLTQETKKFYEKYYGYDSASSGFSVIAG